MVHDLHPAMASVAPGRASVRPFAGALSGLGRQQIAVVLALAAVFALWANNGFLVAWRGGEMRQWLADLAGNFVSTVMIAAVMWLPIVMVGNLGPQAGWKRYAALALAIVLTAPLAAALRFAYIELAFPEPPTLEQYPMLMLRFWTRYAELAALGTLVAEFYRHETLSVEAMHRAEIDRQALDREMAEARLQVLQAQIEPHFLFNTLANVRRLYQTDMARGRSMLDHLMRYLEVALPRMRDSRSTLAGEVTLIESYLEVQRIRMGRRLAFEIDVPLELRPLEVPPMMLLTLVENAIKHGLNPLPEGGSLRVQARREGELLCIDVADSGRGFHATSGGGTGLANIRARLSAMHGDAASLALAENYPRGVTSTLRLPAVSSA
jgi:Histidine kinase